MSFRFIWVVFVCFCQTCTSRPSFAWYSCQHPVLYKDCRLPSSKAFSRASDLIDENTSNYMNINVCVHTSFLHGFTKWISRNHGFCTDLQHWCTTNSNRKEKRPLDCTNPELSRLPFATGMPGKKVRKWTQNCWWIKRWVDVVYLIAR